MTELAVAIALKEQFPYDPLCKWLGLGETHPRTVSAWDWVNPRMIHHSLGSDCFSGALCSAAFTDPPIAARSQPIKACVAITLARCLRICLALTISFGLSGFLAFQSPPEVKLLVEHLSLRHWHEAARSCSVAVSPPHQGRTVETHSSFGWETADKNSCRLLMNEGPPKWSGVYHLINSLH